MSEDFLNDIGLTDNDIIVEDNAVNTTLYSIETLCNEIKQKYDSTLMVTIDHKFVSEDIIKNIISQTSRQLSDLFDIYCIDHSDVYATYNSKSNTSYKNRYYVNSESEHETNNAVIRQCDNYTEVINNDSDEKAYYCIRMFFNKPFLSNIKQMLKFIKSLCNIIYHHDYFDDCMLIGNTDVFLKQKESYSYNYIYRDDYKERDILFNIENISKYNFHQLEIVSKWVKWFFGNIIMAEFMTMYVSYNFQKVG